MAIEKSRGVPVDAATVGFWNNSDWAVKDSMWVRDTNEERCLHEEHEKNARGNVHMLSCPCPKCTPRC